MVKTNSQLGVGLFGLNGHQVHDKLPDHDVARLAAVGGCEENQWPDWIRSDASVVNASLDDMLSNKAIHLMVLCSPKRSEQAEHAIRCLEAGKHVYAEKPCALNETDLDRILAAAKTSGRVFREMNDTMFTPPFHRMRDLIADGAVGRVVQVVAQKSYPLAGKPRPTDDQTDGGLLRQVGVHAVRMIEHIAGQPVVDGPDEIEATESIADDPSGRPMVVACTLNLRLVNGGTATAACNYLNPQAFPTWGNESLRVFGMDGMIECTDGGKRSRWVTHDQDLDSWHENAAPARDPFEQVLLEIRGKPHALLPLELDLHPTRIVLRAFAQTRFKIQHA